MTQSEFRQQLANASELVKTWPAWKQNILVNSSLPTVSAPRAAIKLDGIADKTVRDSFPCSDFPANPAK